MISTAEKKNKQEEQRKLMLMVKEMEDYIFDNEIKELCEFSRAIRNTHEDWYKVLTLECTEYFMCLYNSEEELEWEHIKKLSSASKTKTIKEMEEYIDENNILYFCDFARAIRDNEKWRKILIYDRADYFVMYIRSKERAETKQK